MAIAQIEVANQQIDVSRENLRAITTRYYKSLNGAADNIPLLVPKPNDIEAWSKAAIGNSKQLAAAKYAVDVAQKMMILKSAAKKPTLILLPSKVEILSLVKILMIRIH